MTPVIRPYSRVSQEDSPLDPDGWKRLQEYVEDISGPVKSIVNNSEIEEDPMQFSNEKFLPWGWVGSYEPGVEVVPAKNSDRVTEDGYRSMIEKTQGWIETVGPLSAKALSFSPDVLLDARALYASYSRRLIQLTEQLLASRIPVEVEREKIRGQTLVGRPVFEDIQQEKASRSGKLVSETVSFRFDNLQTRLLIRFHAELLQEMNWLREELGPAGKELEGQMAYHQEFIDDGLPVDILNKSLDTDFSDPEIMAELRRDATAQMLEVVDHWEAYLRDQAMRLDPSERYQSCIKPMSKVYELWLLSMIIDIIASELDSEPVIQEDDLSDIEIEDVRIYHDTSSSKSKYIAPFLRPEGRKQAGCPDLMISVDGELRWIGEAKCRPWRNIRKGDAMRFLAYIVDYLPAEAPTAAAIIAPESTESPKYRVGDSIQIEGHSTTRGVANPEIHDQPPGWLVDQLVETDVIT